jgi:Protein of unknown function (DUF732)
MKTKNTIVITVSALVATVALSSCAAQAVDHKASAAAAKPAAVQSSEAPQPADTPTHATPTHAAAPVADAPVLLGWGLHYLRHHAQDFVYVPDHTITSFSKTICQGLDQGRSIDQTYNILTSPPHAMTAHDTSALVAFAVVIYCPDHKND